MTAKDKFPARYDLEEKQVRDRLRACKDPAILDDYQAYGESLNNEGIEQIKALEGKATSVSAYGAAVVTILVSTYAIWSSAGDGWSRLIVCFAALSGVVCEAFAVRTLSLVPVKLPSEEGWLIEIQASEKLKKYRILTLWGLIHARTKVYDRKVKYLLCAQLWLSGAVTFLFFLLVQLAVLDSEPRLLSVSLSVPKEELWQFVDLFCGGLGSIVVCGLCFCFLLWRTGRVLL